MALLVYDTSTDITEYVDDRSFYIDDQLANRRNTCKFAIKQREISQGKSVYVYETLELRAEAASGQAVLSVKDTYQDTSKFIAGDQIIVDIKGAGEKKYTILSVDHSARTVTLTTNLSATIATTKKIGRLIFGGIVISNPDKEIAQSGTFEYLISCVDWSNLFDRQIVIQQYENMYLREIMGRIIYYFCPTDSSSTLDDFEAAWTQAGHALAMADETTDRLRGTKSQKTGTSGTSEATWTKTITAQDISAFRAVRFWWKIAADQGVKMSTFKLRIGQDSSNFYEYTITNKGAPFEDCWNLESVILNEYTSSTGTPNLTAVDWLQISITSSAAIPAGSIYFDHMQAFTGSFTLQNCIRSDQKFTDVRVKYKRPSQVIEDLSKRLSLFWYIDRERDLHLFESDETAAPFSLTDSSENYRKLSIETDITQLRNRVVVRGGEAPSDDIYTQIHVADGQETSFRLDYKPSGLLMYIDDGGGYDPITIGVENFVDETTVDYVYNFNEKNVRKTAATATPTAGYKVKFTMYPYQPIRLRVTHPASIAAMAALTGGDGAYDGPPIEDTSISSFDDARLRGQAELAQYANPIRTATFGTDVDGLMAGQTITITDSSRSVSAEEFLIQRVTRRVRNGDRFEYTITASTTLFGIIEFFQMLLKKSDRIDLAPSELVDAIANADEEITFADLAPTTLKDKVVYAGLTKKKTWDFIADDGSKTSDGQILATATVTKAAIRTGWYAEFIGSETGTAQFAASNHNNAKEMRLTTAVGGVGKELKVRLTDRIPADASKSYTVDVWTEIQAALTNVSSGGLRVLVKEYDSGGSLLATNTVTSLLTAAHDFVKRSVTFTSNASTTTFQIEVSLYQAAGTARIADLTVTSSTTETATLAATASFGQAT